MSWQLKKKKMHRDAERRDARNEEQRQRKKKRRNEPEIAMTSVLFSLASSLPHHQTNSIFLRPAPSFRLYHCPHHQNHSSTFISVFHLHFSSSKHQNNNVLLPSFLNSSVFLSLNHSSSVFVPFFFSFSSLFNPATPTPFFYKIPPTRVLNPSSNFIAP